MTRPRAGARAKRSAAPLAAVSGVHRITIWRRRRACARGQHRWAFRLSAWICEWCPARRPNRPLGTLANRLAGR